HLFSGRQALQLRRDVRRSDGLYASLHRDDPGTEMDRGGSGNGLALRRDRREARRRRAHRRGLRARLRREQRRFRDAGGETLALTLGTRRDVAGANVRDDQDVAAKVGELYSRYSRAPSI